MKKTDLIKLDVFLNQAGQRLPVGVLADQQGDVYFEFHAEFIEQGIEISPIHLPLKKRFFKNNSRNELYRLPGVFYDSLPDGWGLLVMDRVFRSKGISIDAISSLDRLAYLGNRAMGALEYHPESEYQDGGRQGPLDLIEMARESELILSGEADSVIKEIIIAGGSPGGARPKALIGLQKQNCEVIFGVYDIPDDYDHYIVKFPGHNEPKSIGQVEYIYSQMAKHSGIEMMDTQLLRAGRDYYFAVKRFDRDGNKKVHSHTLAGLLQSDFRKPEVSYQHLLNLTRHLTNNQAQVESAYRRLVFNVIAHNRDDHAKNFSFIMSADGKWRLSPAYDLVFSQGIAGWHTMDIGGSKDPGLEHLLQCAKQHQINTRRAKQIIEQVQEGLSNWPKLSAEYDIHKPLRNDISKALSRTYR